MFAGPRAVATALTLPDIADIALRSPRRPSSRAHAFLDLPSCAGFVPVSLSGLGVSSSNSSVASNGGGQPPNGAPSPPSFPCNGQTDVYSNGCLSGLIPSEFSMKHRRQCADVVFTLSPDARLSAQLPNGDALQSAAAAAYPSLTPFPGIRE